MAISITFDGFESTDHVLDFVAKLGTQVQGMLKEQFGQAHPRKPVAAPAPTAADAPAPAPEQLHAGSVPSTETPAEQKAAPKKRGRPKKTEQASDTTAAPASDTAKAAPKKRGRPKKTEQASDTTAAPASEPQPVPEQEQMPNVQEPQPVPEQEPQPVPEQEQMPNVQEPQPVHDGEEITQATLRGLIRDHAATHDKSVTMERLRELNVDKLSALDPSQYAVLHSRLVADIEAAQKQQAAE